MPTVALSMELYIVSTFQPLIALSDKGCLRYKWRCELLFFMKLIATESYRQILLLHEPAGHLMLLQTTIYNCNYMEHHQDSGGLMADCRLYSVLLWTNSNNNLDCSWLLLSTESGWPSLKVFVPPTCVVAVVCVVVPPCTAITPLLVCILCPVSWQSSAWRRANKS